MFDCDCSCDFDGGDYPEFYDTKIVKARDPHFCSECGEVIKKGTKYRRTTGKWDGMVKTYKTCTFCDNISRVCCSSFGYLWDEFRETWQGKLSDLGLRMFMYEYDDEWLEQQEDEPCLSSQKM